MSKVTVTRKSTSKAPFTKQLRPYLFIPDTHVPYEDKKAWTLMMKVAASIKPHGIIIGGDFADFYSVSSHSKNPNRVSILDTEVQAVNEKLTELDALGATDKRYIEGNHEWRLERYLADRAPALFNVTGVRDLFKLKERGWSFIPYKGYTKLGKIYLSHDMGIAGQNAHRRHMAAFQGNTINNHTHRMEMSICGSLDGGVHGGWSFGWLGDRDAADYMYKVNALRDWVLGFGIGYHHPATDFVYVQPVPIIEYTAVVGGQFFSL